MSLILNIFQKTRKELNLKQDMAKLAIINWAEYNIHMHEVMEQRLFLCTDPEKVPSVSDANRHFLWISKQVNQFWVLKQIGGDFKIINISFRLHS